MAKIIVAGLGPGKIEHLPIGTFELMRKTSTIYLRTEKHPLVEELLRRGISFYSFDDLYEKSSSFQDVYDKIVLTLLEEADKGPVLYAVPGHPMVAESTVRMLLEAAKDRHEIEIIPAMSCLDAIYAALRLDPTQGLMILDAFELLEPDRCRFNTNVPVLCTQVYDRKMASEVKLTLMEHYPDDHPVVLIHSAGVPGEETVKTMPLFELDRQEDISYLTSLFVPEVACSSEQGDPFRDLVELMEQLRSPNGCPWDKEQDFDSLKRYVVEETYEVIEAVEDRDMNKLQEELGDLLLQIVFYSQMAREKNIFDIDDVIGGISEKLIRRHPHVFGKTVKVNCVEDVNVNWEKIKHAEKEDRPRFDIPRGLPALMRAEKVQKKAAEAGFDWPDITGPWEKVNEELEELNTAVKGHSLKEMEGELGDLLFAVVNVARFLNVDPEEALTRTVNKFIKRFEHIEKRAKEMGQYPEKMSLEELDRLWDEAKRIIDL